MPTYDELQKDLKKNGITLSKYDDYYAQNDPNFGYNIMNAKLDYMNAATPEAKALANASAESYRAKLGYSGGGDGEGYILLDNEPARGLGSYGDPSSSFFNKYMGDYGDPNGYDAQYRSTLNGLLNYKPFSYDVNADPLYQSYKQQYTRNGELAMRDTLGQVSARTGGLASSYATTAANQAYNGYMQALSDKIPDLYQIAYQQYMDEYNRKANGLSMLDSARSTDYGRWQDDQSRLLNAFNISAQNEAAAGAGSGYTPRPQSARGLDDPDMALMYRILSNTYATNGPENAASYLQSLSTKGKINDAEKQALAAAIDALYPDGK